MCLTWKCFQVIKSKTEREYQRTNNLTISYLELLVAFYKYFMEMQL